MRVTVTGASGFIGGELLQQLLAGGHQVRILGRALRKGLPPEVQFSIWDPEKGSPPIAAIEGADAVIHLAGEPVAQRWTEKVKRHIRESRVLGTERLVETVGQCASKPKALVCASAIGYYGDRADETLTESSKPGSGFLPEVCVEWENAALGAEALGVRVATIRTGVVLGKNGGALAKMLPPFKACVGGKIGSGKQWMSWIHLEDLAQLFLFAAESPAVRGAINGSSPVPVTNADFTQALGRALQRPAVLPVPLFALKILFGEMSEILIGSQRALPEAALSAGFTFRHPELAAALQSVVE
ncbi:MAG: TIGR01777 family oxidoreductase [Acidobacteriia bacterium]|nr:TIGR01777 family oxidoreductase [Terriglobia bacterium]